MMVSASGVTSSHKRISFSKTIFSPYDPNGLCDSFKLLLQKKQGEKNSKKINEQNVATADNLLESKCISTEQPKLLLAKGLN